MTRGPCFNEPGLGERPEPQGPTTEAGRRLLTALEWDRVPLRKAERRLLVTGILAIEAEIARLRDEQRTANANAYDLGVKHGREDSEARVAASPDIDVLRAVLQEVVDLDRQLTTVEGPQRGPLLQAQHHAFSLVRDLIARRLAFPDATHREPE